MRLLVIEDEVKLAQYLHKGLSENGHVVDVAHDGIEGRRLATGGDYDLVLLDVMLPGVDGFGVLAAMRQQGRKTPVLMLTARDKVEDRVRGLEGGADDYLVKPFAFSELLARVGALLRRGGHHRPAQQADRTAPGRPGDRPDRPPGDIARPAAAGPDRQGIQPAGVAVAPARADPVAHHAGRAGVGHELRLRHQRRRGRRAPLRAKLDDPFDSKLLHTVRGMGYVLEERAP
jgi:two-component system copper resistance phosphate regulon response regulator CusR